MDGLQEELREKTEEVAKGKVIKESLLKKIDTQASKLMTAEQLLNDQDREKDPNGQTGTFGRECN